MGGHVGVPSGAKYKSRFLSVQRGQFVLQQDVKLVGATDVAGATSISTTFLNSLVHGVHHIGNLAHSKIVIGAPHRDIMSSSFAVIGRLWKISSLAFQISKNTVPPVVYEVIYLLLAKKSS